MGKPISSQTESLADGRLLSVNGDIDYSCSAVLRAAIHTQLAEKPERLVIDLAGVPYMDSSGVATLVEALQVQTKAKRKLVLCNLQPRVRGIFEIAKLTSVFKITENVETAKTL